MATKSKYEVQAHKLIEIEDLPSLPKELKEDYIDISESILAYDPKNCFGFPRHYLKGKLKDCMALEIEWEGDPNAYRLVYRILEKPAPKRVEILSFAKHEKSLDGVDPPYSKAQERLGRLPSQKKKSKKKKKRKR